MPKTYKILGNSMRFLLDAGDSVFAELCGFDGVAPGDILVLLRWKGRKPDKYVIHRAVFKARIFGREILVTKGDAAILPDLPPGNFQLIGKAGALRKKDGRFFKTQNIPSNRAWPLLSIFSPVANKIVYFFALAVLFLFKTLYFILPDFFYVFLNFIYRSFETGFYPGLLAFFSSLTFSGALETEGPSVPEDGIKTGKIFGEEIWSGEIQVMDYLQIMPGASVKILPGSIVTFKRNDRLFFPVIRGIRGRTEEIETGNAKIINYGSILSAGTRERPISFSGESFGGVYSLGSGELKFTNSLFSSSKGPALFLGDNSFCRLEGCSFRENRIDIIASGSSGLSAEGCIFEKPAEFSLSAAGDSRVLLTCCKMTGSPGRLIEASDSSGLGLVSAELSGSGAGVFLKKRASFYARSSSFFKLGDYALHSQGKGNIIKLEGSRLFSNSNGVSAGNFTLFSLFGSEVTENAGAGVSLSGPGKVFLASSSVSRNGEGFSSENAARISASDSSFTGNGSYGVKISGFPEAAFENCSMNGNETGIETRNSGRLYFKNAEISDNSRGAAFLRDIEEAFFSGGKISGNGNGINVSACSRFSCRNATAFGNGGAAFSFIKVKDVFFSGVKAENNGKGVVSGKGKMIFFENSSVSGSKSAGISVSDCLRAYVKSCVFSRNGNGIEIENAEEVSFSGVKISDAVSAGAVFKKVGTAIISGGSVSGGGAGMRAERCGFFSFLDMRVSGNSGPGISLKGLKEAFFSGVVLSGNKEGIVCQSVPLLNLKKLLLSENVSCGLNFSDSGRIIASASKIEGGDKGFYIGGCREFFGESLEVSGNRISAVSLSETESARLYFSTITESGEGFVSEKVKKLYLKKIVFSGNKSFGINISNCGLAQVESCGMEGGKNAFYAENCRSVRVRETTAEKTSVSGFSVKGSDEFSLYSCAALQGRDGVILENTGAFYAVNTDVSGNSSFGMRLSETGRGELKDCRIKGNKNGIRAKGCPSFHFSGGTVSDNSGSGISLARTEEAEFSCSSFSGNGEGLISENAGELRFEKASFCGNRSFGINLSGAGLAELRSCDIKENENGFQTCDLQKITLKDVKISDNRLSGAILGGSGGVSLSGGVISGNGNGFEIKDCGSLRMESAVFSSNRLTGAVLEDVKKVLLKSVFFSDNKNGMHAENSLSVTAGKTSFSGNKGSGASLIEVGKCLFSGVALSSNGEGLIFDKGGSLRVENGSFSLNGRGAAVSGSESAFFACCSVEKNSEGVNLTETDSAEIRELHFLSNKKGLRMGGTKNFLLLDSVFKENSEGFSCFSFGSGELDGVSFLKNGKAFEAAGFRAVRVLNSFFDLAREDILMISGTLAEFKNTGIRGDFYPYLKLSAPKIVSRSFTFNGAEILFLQGGNVSPSFSRRFLPLLIRLSVFPPCRAFFSAFYLFALKIIAFALSVGGVSGIYLYRSLASGDWVPVLSDIDLIVLAEDGTASLTPRNSGSAAPGVGDCDDDQVSEPMAKTGTNGFYPDFCKRYSALKRLFPFLGEILIGEPGLIGEFLNSWGLKGEEFFSGNRLLSGGKGINKKLNARSAGLSDMNEALYAYTTAFSNYLGGGPEEIRKRNVFKSWVDINRFLDRGPERFLPRREYFRKKLSGAGETPEPGFLYKSLGLISEAMKDYSGRVSEYSISQANEEPSLSHDLERIRRGIGCRIKFLLLPLYRSYIIVPDFISEKDFFALVENLREAGSGNFNGTFLILSESAFSGFLCMPYLNNPFLYRSLSPGRTSGLSLADGQIYSDFLLEKFSPEEGFLEESVRAAYLHFSVSWRYCFAVAGRRDLHYLYTRACGLRLFASGKIAANIEDAVSLSREFNGHFSSLNKTWGNFLKDGFGPENYRFIRETLAEVKEKK